MASSDTVQIAVVTAICVLLIVLRTTYRLTLRCKVHAKCHRKAHIDDIWMAASIIPLLGRAVTIGWSSSEANNSSNVGLSDTQRFDDKILSNKLLIPSRICYMLFLWFMKMCLLELYLRLAEGIPAYINIGKTIRWSLYLTAIAVLLATTLECRPLKLAWNGDPAGASCRKGRANLITMAVTNILTDIALILFPITLLRRTGLELTRFIRLAILFALGSLVIITTLIRLPLILRDNAQKTRSLWASIEIVCACVIANAPFLQAVIVDAKLNGSHNTSMLSLTQTGTGAKSKNRSRAVRSEDEGDEIGLWTIEKRVSFTVEGKAGGGSVVESVGVVEGMARSASALSVEHEVGRTMTTTVVGKDLGSGRY